VNAGMLVGHNTLRLMVMGMANRAPTANELNSMIALTEEALGAGALGLSSGLFTAPGSYAEPAEMIALGHVLKRHDAGYFTHLRDESNKVLDALAEAIDIAEQCRVHVEIVHFKCSGLDNWGKAAQALAMIAQAKSRGLDVDCDAYPYAAGSNPLKNLMPQWVQAGGVEAMLERLKLPETRARIRADIDRNGLNNWGRIPSWDCVQISISPNLPRFAGRTIGALAAERGQDPIDTVADYLVDDKGATRVLVTSISEGDIDAIIRSPAALVGSDGNCVATYGTVSQGLPHPRFYGTFPRIIGRYVGERGLIPLELAVHKMTGATAQALKLADRGLLREGYCADVTIFDPNDFKDRATYADPHQYPTGDRTTVIVNGTLVVENATHTGALPGAVLRRGRDGRVS
jgi:N-acyl-D-amino-acid deacylase